MLLFILIIISITFLLAVITQRDEPAVWVPLSIVLGINVIMFAVNYTDDDSLRNYYIQNNVKAYNVKTGKLEVIDSTNHVYRLMDLKEREWNK